MKKETKKILLLTLGSRMMKQENEAGYLQTQYIIDGQTYKMDGIEVKANLVAEPIVESFNPDEIFILGTVKSFWHQMYATAITADNSDQTYKDDVNYKRLWDIEANHGINTNSEELNALSKEITEIFNGINSWYRFPAIKQKKARIHVLLTKYGIDKNELRENYRILKDIELFLQEDIHYEVAFDITHSFRSLPIYNLIIFNYIKNITKYDLKISHVYYGNSEASHELDNRAPIVDLADLVDVLNLTNGVAEFKDTGNSVSLVNLLEDDEEIRQALWEFDLATQLNAFDKVRTALEKLTALLKLNAREERYTGIRQMISTVLAERFLGEDNAAARGIEEINDADLKFCLTQWFFNQNRMGLGIATGLEALRDLITPVFISSRGFDLKDERKYRENAEAFFQLIATNILNSKMNQSSLEAAVCSLGCKLRSYKDIRNVFAHSLSNTCGVDIDSLGKNIKKFEEELFTLKREAELQPQRFEDLFKIKKGNKVKTQRDECRVILNCSSNCDYEKYTKSNNNSFDVLYLKEEVYKKFLGGIDGKKYIAEKNAYFLREYLKYNLPDDYEKVHIIIHGCQNYEAKTIFSIVLEGLSEEDDRITIDYSNGVEVQKCRSFKGLLNEEKLSEEYGENRADYAAINEIPLVKWIQNNTSAKQMIPINTAKEKKIVKQVEENTQYFVVVTSAKDNFSSVTIRGHFKDMVDENGNVVRFTIPPTYQKHELTEIQKQVGQILKVTADHLDGSVWICRLG